MAWRTRTGVSTGWFRSAPHAARGREFVLIPAPRRLPGGSRNTKIIYFRRQTAYRAQKKRGGGGAVSDRALHLSGLRGPELDACRGRLDRRLYAVGVDEPRSDLNMVKSGAPAVDG